jgi:hypothetical protein
MYPPPAGQDLTLEQALELDDTRCDVLPGNAQRSVVP